MKKKDIINFISKISEPIAEQFNFELVDVEFVREGRNHFLRIFIDKSGGITIDDCQKMSEAVSDKLDEDDPINVSYYLEVSSPGLDRPLKTDKDLNRNLGEDVEVNLYKSIQNKKKFVGELLAFDDDSITILDSEVGEIAISRDIISKINLAVIF